MARRMGRWDCSCGYTNIGTSRHCAACGKSRGNDVEFYLPDGEPEITDPKLLSQTTGQPDWECAACGGANRSDANFCVDCGAGRGSSKSHEVVTYGLNEVPHSVEDLQDHQGTVSSPSSTSARSTEINTPSVGDWVNTDMRSPEPDRRIGWPTDNSGSSSRSFTTGISSGISQGKKLLPALGVIAAIALMAFAIWFFFIRTVEVTAKATSFSWNRTVHIQEYRTVRESDWSLPASGRLISTSQKINHYDQVFDHWDNKTRQVFDHTEYYDCGQRSNGDGTFDDVECSRDVYRDESYQEAVYRDEPVYQDWYTYDIDKWVNSRDAKLSGTNRNDPVPTWPAFTLNLSGQTVIGAERESSREEHYYVVLTDEKNKDHTREEDFTDWNAYDQKAEYTLILSSTGSVRNDPLRPKEE